MNNKDFLSMLEKYRDENMKTWDEVNDELGISKNTIMTWRRGVPISKKKQRAIIILTSKPPEIATDNLTRELIYSWERLSKEQRLRVLSFITKVELENNSTVK